MLTDYIILSMPVDTLEIPFVYEWGYIYFPFFTDLIILQSESEKL